MKLVAVALAVAAATAPSIRLDRSIANVELGARPSIVRALLGAPTTIRKGAWREGNLARTWIYGRRGITVVFLLAGGRLTVWEVETTDPADRTARGVGVGSTEHEVLRLVPDASCLTDPYVGRICRRPREGGVGGTSFLARRGLVVRVTVFAPPY